MNFTRRSLTAAVFATACAVAPMMAASPVQAASAEALAADGARSLHKLEAMDPAARVYERHAKAVLVFPSILKAGLVFGGETGDGVLLVHGRPVGYYNLSGGSWGLQAGGQSFSYALFFMTDSSLDYLKKSDGFSVGTGPSIVVVKAGAGAAADVTTLTQDVYAFPYGQKGLMADLTLQGTKISRIHPD
jgi:lipid-binding SYLF domain-containing protein